MATPEVDGKVIYTAGTSTRSLGMDVHVGDAYTQSILMVVTGYRATGIGATAAVQRVDAAQSSLNGTSVTGSVDTSRMILEQFQNLTPGIHRVHCEPSGAATFEKAFLLAILLRDCGEIVTMASITASPKSVGSSTVPVTSRLVSVYWSFEATAIDGGGLTTLLDIDTLPHGLGSLVVQTARGPVGAASFVIAPTPIGESVACGVYAVCPLA